MDEKKTSPKIVIGAIVKNEGPYLLEWVAYHRTVGVDHFFIADNESDDGGSELLAAMQAAGLITHIPFPSIPGRPPQLYAYDEILRRHSGDADWFAFIDADEFLIPTGHLNIKEVFASTPADVGAVAINWALYGSSFQLEGSDDLVIERFTRRADDDYVANHRFKSVVRPGAIGRPVSTHRFEIKPGYRFSHPDGTEVAINAGRSSQIPWAGLRLNHYVVKSRAEFQQKKAPRGRGAALGKRSGSFFLAHDRNEVEDPMPASLVETTRQEMDALRRELSAFGCQDSILHLEREIAGLRPLCQNLARGHVDRVEINGADVTITGWAIDFDGNPAQSLSLRIGQDELHDLKPQVINRPDVARVVRGAQRDCGFSIKFSLFEFSKRSLTPSATVTIIDELGTPVHQYSKPLWASPVAGLQSEPPKIPTSPSMPRSVVEALKAAMKESSCYLEYGSGGSTVLAARTNIPSVICVESGLEWLSAVRDKVADCKSASHFKFIHVDLGKTTKWEYPVDRERSQHWHEYPLRAWEHCRRNGQAPDLVLIDGRLRVACLLATLLLAKPGCRIFFDDYTDRRQYHAVEQFVTPLQNIDRMALFEVPLKLDREAAWLAMVKAVSDPT